MVRMNSESAKIGYQVEFNKKFSLFIYMLHVSRNQITCIGTDIQLSHSIVLDLHPDCTIDYVKIPHTYVDMKLIYVSMHYNYIDMQSTNLFFFRKIKFKCGLLITY